DVRGAADRADGLRAGRGPPAGAGGRVRRAPDQARGPGSVGGFDRPGGEIRVTARADQALSPGGPAVYIVPPAKFHQADATAPLRCLLAFVASVLLAATAPGADDAMVFPVVVQGLRPDAALVIGELSVKGKKLGTCYENDDKKTPAGTYKGVVRTTSMRNHA